MRLGDDELSGIYDDAGALGGTWPGCAEAIASAIMVPEGTGPASRKAWGKQKVDALALPLRRGVTMPPPTECRWTRGQLAGDGEPIRSCPSR
jgi:hypothetical protein